MPTTCDVGDGRILTGTFTDADGGSVAIDAGDVKITVKDPAGEETTYTGADLDVSINTVELTLVFNMPGQWTWAAEWDNSFDPPQAEESTINVRVPRVTRQNT